MWNLIHSINANDSAYLPESSYEMDLCFSVYWVNDVLVFHIPRLQ